jgi:lipoate-protein ligase A
MAWRVIESVPSTAGENMERDTRLLADLGGAEEPILHIYGWKGRCATYGYFLEVEEHLRMEEVRRWGVSLARRPTGGGVVFHIWDLAFSVLIPAVSPLFSLNTLQNYATINGAVERAAAAFLGSTAVLAMTSVDGETACAGAAHFCMARPTKYDVVEEGKKIAGAAQRKTRAGFLHQGTIAVAMPEREMLFALLRDAQVAEAILRTTRPLLPGIVAPAEFEEARRMLGELLKQELNRL